MKISVNFLIAALALSPALLCSSGSEALAQSTQQRQTDQQFLKRLSGYAEQLEQRLDRLGPRIEALDPSPLVTLRMPLDDFDKGVALVVERKALKVCLHPD